MAAQRRPWKVPVSGHAHRVLALDSLHEFEFAIELLGCVVVGRLERHVGAIGVHGGVDGVHAAVSEASHQGWSVICAGSSVWSWATPRGRGTSYRRSMDGVFISLSAGGRRPWGKEHGRSRTYLSPTRVWVGSERRRTQARSVLINQWWSIRGTGRVTRRRAVTRSVVDLYKTCRIRGGTRGETYV